MVWLVFIESLSETLVAFVYLLLIPSKRINIHSIGQQKLKRIFRCCRERLQPILKLPDFNQPFPVKCDASGIAIGAVLSQETDLLLTSVRS